MDRAASRRALRVDDGQRYRHSAHLPTFRTGERIAQDAHYALVLGGLGGVKNLQGGYVGHFTLLSPDQSPGITSTLKR